MFESARIGSPLNKLSQGLRRASLRKKVQDEIQQEEPNLVEGG